MTVKTKERAYFHTRKSATSPRAADMTEQPSAESAERPLGGEQTESPVRYEWLAAFDRLKDPVFVHDKYLRILRCNAAYAERAGEPMEALIGRAYWTVFPKISDEHGNLVQPSGKELFDVDRSEIFTTAGETFLTYDITAHKASGEFWYCGHLMENITARRKGDETAELKNAFSDVIFAHAPGVLVVLDRGLKIVRFNTALNNLTGLSDAELQGASILTLTEEVDQALISKKIEEAFTSDYAECDVRLLSHDSDKGSSEYNFAIQRFEHGGVPYVVAFCYDKTDHKRMVKDMIRETMISDMIIECAPRGIFMLDQQSKLVRWNKNLCMTLGLTNEQMRGCSILSVIHEEDRPLAAAKLLTAFATGYAEMEVRVPTGGQGMMYVFKTLRRFIVDGVPYVVGFNMDITERKRATDDLAKEKAFFEALMESAPGLFYVTDTQGDFVRWNGYFKNLTGLSDAQLKQRNWLMCVQEQDRPLAAESMKKAFEQGFSQTELHVLTCDRGVRLFLMTTRRFKVDDTSYMVGVGVDTTERLAKETELAHNAQTDALTHIANRGHFLAMATQEFARCRRYGHPLTLWMIDVDHFKVVNDTYGHPVGDIVLQSLVLTSQKALRDWDIIGRMGGEEFAVLLPETDSDQSLLVAERLRQMVAATEIAVYEKKTVHITVSIGAATVSEDDASLEMLLTRADRALYEAKRTGRDKVCLAENLNTSLALEPTPERIAGN